MKRYASLSAVLAVICMLGIVPAQAKPAKVAEIEVEMDKDALKNEQALEYWGTLAQDLEGRLATALKDSLDDDGYRMNVRVDEVKLNDGFEVRGEGPTIRIRADDVALQGEIRLYAQGQDFPESEVADEVFAIRASGADSDTIIAGTDTIVVVTPEDRAFYDSLLASFVNGVVNKLNDID